MKCPPSSQTPALVQMMQWIANPFAFMEAYAQRYGDCFSVPLYKGFQPVVFISNPQAIQEILTKDTKEFEAPGEVNEILSPLVGNKGVMMVSGDRHRRERQLLMPPFHGERMRAYGQLIGEITEKVIDSWTSGKPFSVRSYMQSISLRVILRAVFGLEEGGRYQQLEQLLKAMLKGFNNPLNASMLYFPFLQRDLGPLSPWASFSRSLNQIDKLLLAEIQERRVETCHDTSNRTDILSLLMSARDEAGVGMTDEELRDELMTLLLAGHDSTATALTWALYWIHHLPQVREKLLEELNSLGKNPDATAIFRLPYLNAVCAETLRIYPVGMLTFPRLVKTPVQLMGYQLEPGTMLVACIYLTHHRQNLYPESKQFKPERFLERQFSPYEYLPFGGGSRRCIGMAFAQFQMKVVLAKILSRYDLTLADRRPVKPIRRGLISASSDVRLVVTNRRLHNSGDRRQESFKCTQENLIQNLKSSI